MEILQITENGTKASAWTKNDLILDAIFALLPADDLLNVRLVCKQWAETGGRELLRRTELGFTDNKFAGSENFVIQRFCKKPTQYLWECVCSRVKYEGKKFLSVDSPNFQKMLLRDGNFHARSIRVLGYSCLQKLPALQASKVECLQLIKISVPEVQLVLIKVHVLFENLKHLEFREVEAETGDAENEVSSSETVAIEDLSIQESKLESLAIEVSPCWAENDWMFLSRHPKLKKLEIKWYKIYIAGLISRFNDNVTTITDHYYGKCLENILLNVPTIFTTVTTITLRFELSLSNCTAAQKFLNNFSRLVNLKLEVRGAYGVLENFLAGLQDGVLKALCSLHVVNLLLKDEIAEFHNFCSALGKIGYFKKPSWTMVCRGIKRGWVRLTKTNTELVVQLQGEPTIYLRMFNTIEAILGCEDYFPHNYNYAYHHVVRDDVTSGLNDMEILNESALFKSYLLLGTWKGMHDCVCDTCREWPRWLADLPGFWNEIGYDRPNNHPLEKNVRTWTFLFVPRHVLAKWKLNLVFKMAEARGGRRCGCERWDIINRMKESILWHQSFTDPQDNSPHQSVPTPRELGLGWP